MLLAKVIADDEGRTRFEDVEVPQAEAPFAENVEPLLVSSPMPAMAVPLT